MPMLFMELAVGQYTGRGPIGAISQLCPLFKGLFNQNIFHSSQLMQHGHISYVYLVTLQNVFDESFQSFCWLIQYSHLSPTGAGLASVIVSFLMSTYYSVIIAYAIYYLFSAFRPEMPWVDCSHRFVCQRDWSIDKTIYELPNIIGELC